RRRRGRGRLARFPGRRHGPADGEGRWRRPGQQRHGPDDQDAGARRMTADVETAGLRVQHLTRLTRDLTERLSLEMEALRAHRAQDLTQGMAETQEMANLYRRESVQVKANPSLIASAPEADRNALIAATEAFEAVLADHAVTV